MYAECDARCEMRDASTVLGTTVSSESGFPEVGGKKEIKRAPAAERELSHVATDTRRRCRFFLARSRLQLQYLILRLLCLVSQGV